MQRTPASEILSVRNLQPVPLSHRTWCRSLIRGLTLIEATITRRTMQVETGRGVRGPILSPPFSLRSRAFPTTLHTILSARRGPTTVF